MSHVCLRDFLGGGGGGVFKLTVSVRTEPSISLGLASCCECGGWEQVLPVHVETAYSWSVVGWFYSSRQCHVFLFFFYFLCIHDYAGISLSVILHYCKKSWGVCHEEMSLSPCVCSVDLASFLSSLYHVSHHRCVYTLVQTHQAVGKSCGIVCMTHSFLNCRSWEIWNLLF